MVARGSMGQSPTAATTQIASSASGMMSFMRTKAKQETQSQNQGADITDPESQSEAHIVTAKSADRQVLLMAEEDPRNSSQEGLSMHSHSLNETILSVVAETSQAASKGPQTSKSHSQVS